MMMSLLLVVEFLPRTSSRCYVDPAGDLRDILYLYFLSASLYVSQRGAY